MTLTTAKISKIKIGAISLCSLTLIGHRDGRLRTARQRGGCGLQGASSPFGHRGGGASGECGVPQVRQHQITEHETEALLPDDGGRVEGDGCGGWRGAAAGCGAEDGTLITPPGRMRVCARLAGCSLE